MTQPIAVVANPTAGRGRGIGAGARVTRLLSDAGHDVTDLTSATVAAARRRAQDAVQAGARALVVVGGDGMVHLGAGACAGTQVPLGIVPTGTGNDIARGLRVPVGVDAAVAALRHALAADAARRIDAVRITFDGGERWFAGVLGAGFDAVVNERANGWAWPRGRGRYNLAILRELPVFRPLRYRLELDGAAEEVSAMLVAVANGTSYGGGMRLVPEAAFDDGMLDVFVLRPVSTVEFLRIFPLVFRGAHVNHPQVSIRRARRVTIDSLDRRVVGYADGERVAALPLRCEVMPGALTVLTPTS